MKRLSLVFLLAFFSSLDLSAAAYKWVDAEGNVHYSQRPPPSNVKSTVIKPPPKKALPSESKEDANSEKAGKNAGTDDDFSKLSPEERKRVNCEKARANLQILSTNAPITMDKEGKTVQLDAAAREAETKRANDLIALYCSAEKPKESEK
ncbi:MAG: DUF4124 domain-containing protein [Gammaproteobacteria bacterium]|nr:DUF4124 domain-containing protein [Gammaproteobacteria bacterium]